MCEWSERTTVGRRRTHDTCDEVIGRDDAAAEVNRSNLLLGDNSLLLDHKYLTIRIAVVFVPPRRSSCASSNMQNQLLACLMTCPSMTPRPLRTCSGSKVTLGCGLIQEM